MPFTPKVHLCMKQYDSLRQVVALWFVSSLYENMFYCKTVRHVSLIKFYLITSVCYFTSCLSLSLSIRLYSQRLVEDLLNKDSSGGMVQRRFYESISTNIPSIVRYLSPLFLYLFS